MTAFLRATRIVSPNGIVAVDILRVTWAGADYELPTASEYIKGGVMIGEGLKMTGDTLNVTIKAEKYTLPPATSSELGGVMVGDNLSVTAAGRLSAVFLLDTIPSTVEGAMWISNVPDIDNSD